MADFRYRVYGLSIDSAWPLPVEDSPGRVNPDVSLDRSADPVLGKDHREPRVGIVRRGGVDRAIFSDGSVYLRWPNLFEFLVDAGGRRISGRELGRDGVQALGSYLLGPILSFALLRRGVETLHATVVEVDGRAVAIMGESGYGKSSLAASFLSAGHRLITDDLLLLRGPRLLAEPGPSRLKLTPQVVRAMLFRHAGAAPLGRLGKMAVPLEADRWCGVARPLAAVFVLRRAASGSRVSRTTIRDLSPRAAFMEMTRNTFNTAVVDEARLRGQFALASRVAQTVPVRSLSYPPGLDRLPDVGQAMLQNLTRG